MSGDLHWEAAHAMILDYRQNGENNQAFMAMCEEIAEERLAQTEAADAWEDETDS